ncbi:MAG: TrkH family potassium uptake protein [Erysipelotrichaceae bacterium]|nr:TrkH family potassium uptake protein [Erysipelotrichaceae bacterium]
MVGYLHSIFGFKKLTPAQKIVASFLLVIVVGTALLMLPISNQDGQVLGFVDALFTATSATCVTGLVTSVTAQQFTSFGHLIILILIQIGGLGLMTLMAVFILMLKSRLTMREKITVKEMLNQDNVFDMRSFILGIMKYTFLFEGIGALCLSFRMIQDFGWLHGISKAIFLSVSAFCNAGFDTVGDSSLVAYGRDPLVAIPIMVLIVLGGIGFTVWFDVRDKCKPLFKRQISFRKWKKSLSLHTKVVFYMTGFLILFAAFVIFMSEMNNPQTLQGMSFPEQVMTSFFESIALRTAGFSSIIYSSLNVATKFFMLIIMFIGGSPGGTAGGIKTTTVAIFLLFFWTSLRGKEVTTLKRRTIQKEVAIRALSIFTINIIVLFMGIFFLCLTEAQSFLDIVFEAVSAMATVGSSLGITADLTVVGKLIIIVMMFVGRVGITTLLISFIKPKQARNTDHVTFPTGNVIVG